MLKKMKKTIKKHNLFKKGDKLLVAVSGGPDSVALLHALAKLEKYELSVVHFNHLTRAGESDKDEAFVKVLCETYKIPFYTGSADVKELAKEKGASFQNTARDVRYDFFRKTAKELGAAKIVLAHHADDQVETVIINLLRGSGLKGISGMAFVEDDLARPLLEVSREEIEQYISEEKLSYRLDASNLETYYTRNRIRHEIIPLLTKFNPSLSNTVSKMAHIIRNEDEYLSKVTSEHYNKVKEGTNEVNFDLLAFKKLDIALQRRLILTALAETSGTEKDFSYNNVEDILKMCSSGSGLVIHLPHNVRVRTTYGKLHFSKTQFAQKTFQPFNIELNIPGKTILEGIGEITAEYVFKDEQVRSDAFTVYLQEENIILPLKARSRLPGDVVNLLGAKGKTKIKEFFIDMHIERQSREGIPLVIDGSGEIVWVAGIRPGEKCRIEAPGKMLSLSFRQLGISE